jgi:hypothetical protein
MFGTAIISPATCGVNPPYYVTLTKQSPSTAKSNKKTIKRAASPAHTEKRSYQNEVFASFW